MRRFVQAFSEDNLPESWPELAREFLVRDANYNIGKADSAVVLRVTEGALVAERMRWGLVPSWSKEFDTKYTTLTARLARASRSRIFANAWRDRHCVVPLSGYYKLDRTVKPAIPHFIQDPDAELLLVAGLWEAWDKGQAPLHSFTILTHPNKAIPRPLSPDGPAFLSLAAARRWMEGTGLLAGALLRLARPPTLVSYPVSNAYRNRDLNNYMLLEPRSASDYLEVPGVDLDEEEADEG